MNKFAGIASAADVQARIIILYNASICDIIYKSSRVGRDDDPRSFVVRGRK